MLKTRIAKQKVPILRRRLLVRSTDKYNQALFKKRDIRSLTLDDFKPPIALKPEFPKISKKTRPTPLTSMKKHPKVLSDLHVTGKYACVILRCSPLLQNNKGLDTDDISFLDGNSLLL